MTYDFITLLFSKEKYFIKASKFKEKNKTKLFNWRRFVPSKRPWQSNPLNANKSRVALLHELLHIPIVNLIFLHTYYNKIHTSIAGMCDSFNFSLPESNSGISWLIINNCKTDILQWFRGTIFFFLINFNNLKISKNRVKFCIMFHIKIHIR